jgi:DNA polymerase III epsilon subunit-like protein
MRLLLFDTETTGLPKSRRSARHGPNNWPHLVSIAWILLDDDKVVEEKYRVVKPRGWVIPEDSTKIHGITHQQALTEGQPLESVIQEFLAIQADCLVAHNLEFDLNVLENAILWDLQMNPPTYSFKLFYCTMETTKEYCRLPSKFNPRMYKPPKLSELYTFVTKKPPVTNALHNSLYDTQLLKEIVISLHIGDLLKSRHGLQENPSRTLSIRLS